MIIGSNWCDFVFSVFLYGFIVGGVDMLKGFVLWDVDFVDNDGVLKLRIVWSLLLVV